MGTVNGDGAANALPLTNMSTTDDHSPVSTRRSSMALLNIDNDENSVSLAPIDRGRQAWTFIAAAFLLETFIWGFSYSFATILVYQQTVSPWKHYSLSILSAVGSIQLGIQFCMPLAIVVVFRRYPDYIKPSLWASLLVSCGAMLASSWATKAWHLIVLQGVLCGSAGAIMYTPVLLWLSDWFHERRGLAGGIIWAGTGIGGFIFPFLISGLLSRLGYSGMLRVWSALTLVVFAIAIYIVKPRIPPPRRVRKGERGPWPAFPWFILRDPIFLSMGIASLFGSLSTFPVSLYLATYAASLTTSTFAAEVVVGAFNLAGSLGCFALGYLTDISYSACTVVCGLAGALISLLAWGFSDTLAKTYGFAVLFGFFSQMVVAWSGATRDVAGRDPYSASITFTLLSFIRGIASITMPLVSASLYNPSLQKSATAYGRFGFLRLIIFGAFPFILKSRRQAEKAMQLASRSVSIRFGFGRPSLGGVQKQAQAFFFAIVW